MADAFSFPVLPEKERGESLSASGLEVKMPHARVSYDVSRTGIGMVGHRHTREQEKANSLLLCPVSRTLAALPGIPVSMQAGIDEAGRGCLAGPVVAAAVILPEDANIPGLADSKVLSPSRRDGLAAEIGTVALAWGLGVVWPSEIDRINILQATFKAMCHAASVLKVRPEALLVDGNQTVPEHLFRMRGWKVAPVQKAVVDGDALVPSISAASIIAKTFRDMLMEKLDRRYPGYGFARHKGYGSREHLEALGRLGPSPMHRLTFRGVVREKEEAPAQKQGSLF